MNFDWLKIEHFTQNAPLLFFLITHEQSVAATHPSIVNSSVTLLLAFYILKPKLFLFCFFVHFSCHVVASFHPSRLHTQHQHQSFTPPHCSVSCCLVDPTAVAVTPAGSIISRYYQVNYRHLTGCLNFVEFHGAVATDPHGKTLFNIMEEGCG